jgi:hypothetical protein
MQQQNKKQNICLCHSDNLHPKNNKIEEEKSRKWETRKKMLNEKLWKLKKNVEPKTFRSFAKKLQEIEKLKNKNGELQKIERTKIKSYKKSIE